MAAVTVTKPDRALIAALGPFKVEVVQVAGSNGDTYESKLANPTLALFLPHGDMGGTAWTGSAAVSGKTVTIHDPNGTTSNYLLIVFGDGLA
jgi:hypothetical protein